MGSCFLSPKLSNDPSAEANQSDKRSHLSSFSSIQGRSFLCSSSTLPPYMAALRSSQEDRSKPELLDLNSEALASMINPVERSSKSRLFPGARSVQSSSLSSVPYLVDKKSNTSNEVTYTQHIVLYAHKNPTEILPKIYLGSKDDSAEVERLKEIGITHILCLTDGKSHKVDGCKLLTVVMNDNGNSQLKDILKRSSQFIKESQQKGNKLLLHCNRGENRSPTLLIAWLMSTKEFDFYNAYNLVKKARPIIRPHKSYVDQLRELDKELFDIHSTPDDYLAIGLNEGKLTIAESLTPAERSVYRSTQISQMSPEQLRAYRKSQENLISIDNDEQVSAFVLEHKSTESKNT